MFKVVNFLAAPKLNWHHFLHHKFEHVFFYYIMKKFPYFVTFSDDILKDIVCGFTLTTPSPTTQLKLYKD